MLLFRLCVLTTFFVFSLSRLFYCQRARSIKETYASIVRANIYFFPACFSFFAHLSETRSRRTRSVALYRKWSSWRRRRGIRLPFPFFFLLFFGFLLFFSKRARLPAHTSLATAARARARETGKERKERRHVKGNLYKRWLEPGDKERGSNARETERVYCRY